MDNRQEGGNRILLAVTGLTPQVVTETVYALAVQASPRWQPTEVHIITTREGAERARLALCSDDPGWFARLCRDYALHDVAFGPECIHLVPGAAGEGLDDIRSPADNERAADYITDLVRRFTADPRTELHVSIAGGRKTMGYYLGYALSLYGRPQDRLSHVLVGEPFESSWDFFYPTPYERIIETRDRKLANTADAQVTLAEIPFVRLRDGLPEPLLHGRARFSDVVAEAQKALPPVSLVLDPGTRTVVAGGEAFALKPAEFAFYAMFAARAMNGRPGLHWSEAGIAEELLGHYARLLPKASGDYQRAELAYRRGMTKDNFDPAKTHVNQALERALGERRAQPYRIVRLDRLAGTRYQRFGLALPAAAISLAASVRGRRPD